MMAITRLHVYRRASIDVLPEPCLQTQPITDWGKDKIYLTRSLSLHSARSLHHMGALCMFIHPHKGLRALRAKTIEWSMQGLIMRKSGNYRTLTPQLTILERTPERPRDRKQGQGYWMYGVTRPHSRNSFHRKHAELQSAAEIRQNPALLYWVPHIESSQHPWTGSQYQYPGGQNPAASANGPQWGNDGGIKQALQCVLTMHCSMHPDYTLELRCVVWTSP